jgi:hypothetical protein
MAGGALAAGLVGLAGCSGGESAYDAALAEATQPLPDSPVFHDLIRYATLAANAHNTQPWNFASRGGGVDIVPDFARRTPVVDPDDHHIFVSLGCAAENLRIAARSRGLSGDTVTGSQGDIHVDLAHGAVEASELFAAIPVRQCSRAAYDARPMPADVLKRLEGAAAVHGVTPILVTDRTKIEGVLALVIEGNSRQMDDALFVAELKHWLRFSPGQAADTRDGLYGASSGNPKFPRWLGSIMFDLFFSKQAENEKYSEHVRSSSGIAIFVAESNDKQGWISAGRAYQRFALQATVDGVQHAFINQPVEVPEVRRDLQGFLALGDRRPNLLVRFGYGPVMPRSLRRKAADVIVA